LMQMTTIYKKNVISVDNTNKVIKSQYKDLITITSNTKE
jgi:hypothetical protein